VSHPRALLESLFSAAVAGADPYGAVRKALAGQSFGARNWIISAGKASVPMARAAIDALAQAQRTPLGGVVVTSDEGVAVSPLVCLTGDHPVPGTRSLVAADQVLRLTERLQPGDDVVVCISGGASSLWAAPVDGVSADAMLALFRGLHRSGVPIDVMNAFRKRVLRWGGGRLSVALAAARVTCVLASDVIGDDPGAIASGPCSADPWRAATLAELADRLHLWPFVPDEVRAYLDQVLLGTVAETPKPGTAAIDRVAPRVVLGNRDALAAVAAAAAAQGIEARVADSPITGNARSTGAAIASAALDARASWETPGLTRHPRRALVWGGETTVALADGTHGVGGRAQELALSAAQVLHEAGAAARGISILSAGTDGRDGPTDAAGAVVDTHTWSRVAMAGRDPGRDLDVHDAYPALDAAGALLRIGMTGTNVNDVVIALVD